MSVSVCVGGAVIAMLCETANKGNLKREPGWMGGSSCPHCTLVTPCSDSQAQMAFCTHH